MYTFKGSIFQFTKFSSWLYTSRFAAWAEFSFEYIALPHHPNHLTWHKDYYFYLGIKAALQMPMSDVWEEPLAHMLCKIEFQSKVWLAQLLLMDLSAPSATAHED